ncbi:MAG: ABC transporter ATP-binding protein [Syntrophaceae bacterium]|nr:ABC transporter ATP-binding protein [Syntrophaceae bacterium]
MSNIVIKAENLGKKYVIGHQANGRYLALRDVLVQTARSIWNKTKDLAKGKPVIAGDTMEEVWALRDVSFEVLRGEAVGIIGRNGAGKSTLLKLLSRITEPTAGRATIRGRVASLLEVGTGFHPELTGRENIYLNGTILGMTRAEIKRKFDEIVAFAEIEQYLDTPVKRYSSGMYVRLAFSVAAHLEPEILVVDEVLAVGDAQFQKKCLGKMGDVAKEGRTVLFVSHNMAAIENLCSRALVLERGLVRFAGTQTDAIAEYQRSLEGGSIPLQDRLDRKGSGEVRVNAITFRNLDGQTIDSVTCGQDFDIVLHFEATPGFHSKLVIVSVSVKTQWDVPVFLHHSRMTGTAFSKIPNRGAFVCRIRRLPLTPSTYRIGCSIMIGADYLDSMSDAVELVVLAGDFFSSGEVPPSSHGFCLVDGSWSLES